MKSKKNVVFLLSSVLLLSACGGNNPTNGNNTEEVKKGSVTIGTLSNGTITASKTEGEVGDKITLTVSPSKGYEVDAVMVNGVKLSAVTETTYEFTLSVGTNTVTATFKEVAKTGTVVVYETKNGKVTPSKMEGKVGDEITLKVEPISPYKVNKVEVNGTKLEKLEDDTYKFTLEEGTNVVFAVFNLEGEDVVLRPATISKGDNIANGTISFNKTENLLEGQVVEVTVKAADGYRIDWIKFNGDPILVNDEGKAKLVLKDGANVVTAHFVTINRRAVFSIEEKSTLSLRELNKRSGYKNTNETLKVGTENNFNFKPNISVVDIIGDDFGDPVVDTNQEVKYELYEFKGSDYEKVITPSTYVESFDSVACDIDFKDTAIGKKFRINYSPKNLTEKQEAKPKYHKDFEFEVIKGYNVYEAEELAYMVNIRNVMTKDPRDIFEIKDGNNNIPKLGSNDVTTYYDAWQTFRTKHNLDLNYIASNIILQDNIRITSDDLPSEYFVRLEDGAPAFVGKLNDSVDIYRRAAIGEEGNFIFEGNYFTLDASQIPCIGLEGNSTNGGNGKCQISHAQLFRFTGDGKGSVEMRNIATFGNAPKLGDTVLAGGLIMNKVSEPIFTIKNNISKSWFITYFSTTNSLDAATQLHNPYNIIDSSAKDNFNTFVYSWGGYQVNIIDSDLIGAGGPCIISDRKLDDNSKKDGPAVIPTINVYGNSKLESLVEGTEGWFYAMNANLVVPQIKGLSKLAFNGLNYSYLKTNENTGTEVFNFVWLNKCGSAQALVEDYGIRGNFNRFNKFGDAQPVDSFNYFEQGADQAFKLSYGVYTQNPEGVPPIFETSSNHYFGFKPNEQFNGGDRLFDVSYYFDFSTGKPLPKDQDVKETTAATQALMADESATMTCLYFQGMALGFGLFPSK